VLLNVTENLEIGAAQAEVWKLLNDTPRLASLVPGVEEAVRIKDSELEAYRVRVTEKVGPFKVTMKLEVRVTERVEPSTVGASVKGGDAMGMGRATGSIGVRLAASESRTALTLNVNVEVLGKLATLGAPVVRRRVTELFGEFGRRVVAEFQAVQL
jgi:carbon monoxide dehydrogenase subunit G